MRYALALLFVLLCTPLLACDDCGQCECDVCDCHAENPFRLPHLTRAKPQSWVKFKVASERRRASEPRDALDELNAQRSARGLRPYIRDEGLTRGAFAVAKYRAEHRIYGHVRGGGGDFAFLPRGVQASAGGCAANGPEWGFMSCCRFENWRYAGAASCMGADGRMYCDLFVSNKPN